MAVDLNGRNSMNNDNQDFNAGMIAAICIEIVGVICVCVGLIKWIYGFFAYSIFIEKDRLADKLNSEQATVWFWFGVVTILVAGLIFHIAKPADWGGNQKNNNKRNNSYRQSGNNNRWNGYSDPDDFPNDGYDNSGW